MRLFSGDSWRICLNIRTAVHNGVFFGRQAGDGELFAYVISNIPLRRSSQGRTINDEREVVHVCDAGRK